MPCKVCDHTIQRVCDEGPFWCPRCGTLHDDRGVPDFEPPMIVERVAMMIGRLDNPLLDTCLFDDVNMLLKETIGLLRKDSPCSLNSSMPPPSELAAG